MVLLLKSAHRGPRLGAFLSLLVSSLTLGVERLTKPCPVCTQIMHIWGDLKVVLSKNKWLYAGRLAAALLAVAVIHFIQRSGSSRYKKLKWPAMCFDIYLFVRLFGVINIRGMTPALNNIVKMQMVSWRKIVLSILNNCKPWNQFHSSTTARWQIKCCVCVHGSVSMWCRWNDW